LFGIFGALLAKEVQKVIGLGFKPRRKDAFQSLIGIIPILFMNIEITKLLLERVPM